MLAPGHYTRPLFTMKAPVPEHYLPCVSTRLLIPMYTLAPGHGLLNRRQYPATIYHVSANTRPLFPMYMLAPGHGLLNKRQYPATIYSVCASTRPLFTI